MDALTREWLDRAREDWDVARWLLKAPIGSHNAICFHAQQAAEKALKACLTEDRVTFPRTHDLVALLHLLIGLRGDLVDLMADCKTLQPYAVESRYPGALADVDEAHAAADCCLRIVQVLLSEILRIDQGKDDINWGLSGDD